ncbi:MAG TPA: hypothetical protein VGG65_07880 [Thermoanaerobaculia bacterium]|jgi:hypothetical protein
MKSPRLFLGLAAAGTAAVLFAQEPMLTPNATTPRATTPNATPGTPGPTANPRYRTTPTPGSSDMRQGRTPGPATADRPVALPSASRS